MLTKPYLKKNWQKELSNAITDIDELCRFLKISPSDLPVSFSVIKKFPVRIPKSYASRIKKNDPTDPLLLQVLPTNEELKTKKGFYRDPVGDLNAVSRTGILQKYYGRVLFISAGSCAINCRYCFRKEFPYSEQQLSRQKEQTAIRFLQQNTEITEVILSGGDPLILSDSRFSDLIQALGKIDHLKRIRIHSRIPIVLPERITSEFIDCLTQTNKKVVMVVHCNHHNEISPSVAAACSFLTDKKITLLNQSVLLKGINDTSDQLCLLSERLFEAGIIPYYLHLLDKVSGTHHFEITEEKAIKLIEQVKEKLPGYLVPKLVKEEAGAPSKLAVTLS